MGVKFNSTVSKKESAMRPKKFSKHQLALAAFVLVPLAALASGASPPAANDSAQIAKAMKAVPGFTAFSFKKGGSGV